MDCTALQSDHNRNRYCWGAGRPPQNVPPWHVDYFELKLLKKQPMQEGHSDAPLCPPEVGNKSPLWKGPSLHLETEGHPYGQRRGIQAEKPIVSLTDCLNPKLCLDSSVTKRQCFFVLLIPHQCMVPLCKKYKSRLLWPLLRSHF